MAIGRVPGAALLSNLDRQGLDLSFTTSSQTLAYLDFANFRLGINSVTPSEALDVTGNILVTTGNVLTSANLSYDIGTPTNHWRNIYVGNVASTNITGTLTTASQTNITSIGTLSTLTVSGNIIAQSSVVPTSNIAGNIGYVDKWWSAVYANTINATNLNGTILTAIQPNITNLGNITVNSISVGGNVVIGGNINGSVITANAFIQNGRSVVDTVTTINVTGDVTGSGNVSNIAVTLANTGVVAGVYGSADDEVADRVPKITVDSKGRITNIANVTLTQVGNVTFTDTTISTTSSLTLNSANNGNIILNANGTGIVQILGDDAVGLPYGNTATRPTNVIAGYLRYNTDLVTIEYYNGSTWENNLNISGYLSSETIYPTGATNNYTLISPATTDGVLVSINGTLQQPTTSYTVSGNVITFTETPLSSDVIEVRAIAMNLVSIPAITDGAIRVTTNSTTGNITAIGNLVMSSGYEIIAGNITGTTNGYTIGYKDIPQINAANVTLSVTDGGKHYYSTSSAPITLTVPSHANVALPTGTTIMVVNRGTGNITIAKQVEANLYLAGNATSSNRTITSYGIATLLKVESNIWMLTGTGII
jgi:hypothetical protein